MKIMKIFLAAVTIVAVILATGACGGDADNGADSTGARTAATNGNE